MRLISIFAVTIASFVVISGCNRQQPVEQPDHIPPLQTALDNRLEEEASLSGTTEDSSPLPPQNPSPLSTSTPIPQVPVVSTWLTYTHESGTSVQYPENWQVQPNPFYDMVTFGLRLDEYIPGHRVSLDIYERPHEDRAIADPHTWQTNGEIYWAKPIAVDQASGWEFVFGQYSNHMWHSAPFLNAIYYSEECELDIRLMTAVDSSDILELFETHGFTDTITSRFSVFEHMVDSVKVNCPTQPVTPPPPAPDSPLDEPTTFTFPDSTPVIAGMDDYKCRINPSQVDYLGEHVTIKSSDRDGWCWVALGNWYSFLYPEEWIPSIVGAEALNLRFDAQEEQMLFVQFVRSDLPLEEADKATYSFEMSAPDPLVDADEVQIEKTIKAIGETNVLTLLTSKDETAIKRYFFLLDEGFLLMFEVRASSAQLDSGEAAESFATVEQMIKSMTSLMLHRDGDGILWFKPQRHSTQQIIESDAHDPTLCPPQALLPQVEFDSEPTSDGGVSTITMKHMGLHRCLQHPTTGEVWFNTIYPMAYGRLYNSDLWRYFPDEARIEEVLADGEGSPFFQLSPDGEYLILGSDASVSILRSDGSDLRQLLEFPHYTICSEVNVWVEPQWLGDSSGVLVNIPAGCGRDPDSWSFGLWWLSVGADMEFVGSSVQK